MIEIVWDLTPSWWSRPWWQRWSKSKSSVFDHRDPVAVGYAIEEVIRWIHPQATVTVSYERFLVRFPIENEAMFLARKNAERREAARRYDMELTSFASLNAYRDYCAKQIEDYVQAREGLPSVKRSYPTLQMYGSDCRFQLCLENVDGISVSVENRHDCKDNRQALAECMERMAAILRRGHI